VGPAEETGGVAVPAPDGWIERSSPLRASGTTTLNATGNGVIIFDPDHANQRWEIDSVKVSTDQAGTATTIPVVNLALNSDDVATMAGYNMRGATWSGNQDTWSGGIIDVGSCDSFSVIFSPVPGTSGAAMSGVAVKAQLTGTKYSRRS
jgi:hypothetical protein